MNTYRYDNLQAAVKKAFDLKFHCVSKESDLWVVFDHNEGCPKDVEADIFCIFPGSMPVALTSTGTEMLQYMLLHPSEFPAFTRPSLKKTA